MVNFFEKVLIDLRDVIDFCIVVYFISMECFRLNFVSYLVCGNKNFVIYKIFILNMKFFLKGSYIFKMYFYKFFCKFF